MPEAITLVKLSALSLLREETVAANTAAITPIKVAAEAARDAAQASAAQALSYVGSIAVLSGQDSTKATFTFGDLITVEDIDSPYPTARITFPN